MEKTALGRGLDALIGTTEPGRLGERATRVPLDRISPNGYQPRREFAESSLDELKESIRRRGVIQPLLVTPRKDGGYTLVAGERRYRAAHDLGLTEVPVLIKETEGGEDLLELALVENLMREDLNPIEIAEGYRGLIEEFGLTQEEVGRRFGRSRAGVANVLRLLELPEEVRKLVSSGALGFAQARTLLGIDDPRELLRLARRVVAEGIPVRTLEKMVSARRGKGLSRTARPRIQAGDPHLEEAEAVLRSSLKTKVRIRPGKGKGGKVEIEYYSLEELENLCARLS